MLASKISVSTLRASLCHLRLSYEGLHVVLQNSGAVEYAPLASESSVFWNMHILSCYVHVMCLFCETLVAQAKDASCECAWGSLLQEGRM